MPMSIKLLLLSIQIVTDRQSDLARIAVLQVQLGRKVRRLIAEIKPVHSIALVEQVAHPDAGGPAVVLIAGAQVEELIGSRDLVGALAEIKSVHSPPLRAYEPPGGVPVFRPPPEPG